MQSVRDKKTRRNFELARSEYLAGRLSRREFLKWAAVWGFGTPAYMAVGGGRDMAAAAGTVRYLTWGGYSDTALFEAFKKKTGITVNPLPNKSNEEAFLKVKQLGGRAYDVFAADAWWPLQHMAAGTVEPLTLEKFSTEKTLIPMFKNFKTVALPDRQVIGVPYHWEYSTVWYRPDRVDPAPTTQGVLFDKEGHRGRVVWRDRATEMIALMALVRGFKIERPEHPRQWHLEPGELKTIKAELIKAKKRMQPLWFGSNMEAIKMFAANEIDLGFNASNVGHELVRIRGPQVRPLARVPDSEGILGYMDALCLVKGAANRDEGIQLIEWLTSFEGRRMLFERGGFAETDSAVVKWALDAGYRSVLQVRGVVNPEDIFPKIVQLAAPTDLEAWIEAFNEVKAS